LFATAQERGAPKRRRLAMAMVAVVMTAGAAYGVLSASAPFGMNVLRSIEPSVGAARSDLPLALLSLKHDAMSDGTFTVTGLVQDPIGGVPLQRVEAIVYLFDDQGNYFAMGRGALEFGALQPGDESPFVVRVPHASRVGRYRVGFRIEGGGAVAHVDRRPQLAPDPAPGSGS
jgi:hypothetical protein